MEIRIKEEIPSIENYINIRLKAGLSRKSTEAAEIGLKNGLFSLVAYDGNNPIGIGRIIGDGGCFFEIVDIAVIPDYQKKGIGRKIMEGLMNYIHTNAPSTAYVSLMAYYGTPEFYQKFGFECVKAPGSSGMSLRIN